MPACQILFHPGSECQNYVLMVEGVIRVQLIAASGREVLLYQVRPGESCVLTTACLIGQRPYPAEGTTETEVTAFVISSGYFQQALHRSDFFRGFVFENLAQRLATVIGRMEEVVFTGVEQRLAKILVAASGDRLVTTHQALATELGTAREVVSRHLKRFERYGWIRLGRGGIEIQDRRALQRLL
ncbi:MAG: Crp/Fnr family transcriptional regulator [Methylothermaceae bacterium]|nr:Crp/Fnr family transcriptional regulator [Methylothermaceae bacterium]